MLFHKFYQSAILLLFSIFSVSLSAQWIYSQGITPISGTPELQRINLSDNSFVRLIGIGDMGDIAFHPDQRLMGVIFDKVYEIDTITNAYTEIYDIGDFQSVGMTIDYRGIMYFSGYNPNTNRSGIAIFNPVTSVTQIVADFGPINQGFINDLEFYNGQLYLVGELPSSFPETAVLFRVDTTGLNQHDTITTYHMWPGRALAAVNDSCGSQYLVSPSTSLLNFFFPPLDSILQVDILPPDGLFYSSGAASRTSYLGSVPEIRIANIDLFQYPCLGNSNATATIHLQYSRPTTMQYSLDGLSFQADSVFTDIIPGAYQLFIRDGWGCQAVTSFDVEDIPVFNVTIEIVAATCGNNNGAVQIHSLENDLEYALDNSNFIQDSTFTGLNGGIHTLIIRNQSGCADTIHLNLGETGYPIINNVVIIDEKCGEADGRLEVFATSDHHPLQYALNGEIFTSLPIFTGLMAGQYTLTVRDSNGCTADQLLEIHSTGGPMLEQIITSPAHCANATGQILISASSAYPPLLYAINDSEFTTSPQFHALNPGNYQVQVKDSNNCIVQVEVLIDEVPAVQIQSVITRDATCGLENGNFLVISDQAGVNGYSIDNLVFQDAALFSNLGEGIYTIYLLSYDICFDSTGTSINQLSGPVIDNININQPECTNDKASVLIHAHGSSDQLYYSLDSFQHQSDVAQFTGLSSGDYTLMVTDTLGCVSDSTFSIAPGQEPVIVEVIITSASCGDLNGVIELKSENEFLVFELDDATTNINGIFSNLGPGAYKIIISDDLGCVKDTSVVIPSEECGLYLPNVFSPNDDGINDRFSIEFNDASSQLQSFEIFDRWGNLIYSCDELSYCDWNGKVNDTIAQEGVYVYVISYKERNTIHHISGQVTLVR